MRTDIMLRALAYMKREKNWDTGTKLYLLIVIMNTGKVMTQ